MVRNAWTLTALFALMVSAGCCGITRRYTIVSDPPGAMVYRNGEELGPTPVDDYFVYYGNYEFTLVKEGYEPLTIQQEIPAPWYELPLIDFFAENVWPHKIRDIRIYRYKLKPMRAVHHEEVLERANNLRARGRTVQPPPGVKPARPTRRSNKVKHHHHKPGPSPTIPHGNQVPPPSTYAPIQGG